MGYFIKFRILKSILCTLFVYSTVRDMSSFNVFRVLLIIALLFLILMWMQESKWMEENWPEIKMDFFWDNGQLQIE